jgi:hypothetical protein
MAHKCFLNETNICFSSFVCRFIKYQPNLLKTIFSITIFVLWEYEIAQKQTFITFLSPKTLSTCAHLKEVERQVKEVIANLADYLPSVGWVPEEAKSKVPDWGIGLPSKFRNEKFRGIDSERFQLFCEKVLLSRNSVCLGTAHSEVRNRTEFREKLRFEGTAKITKLRIIFPNYPSSYSCLVVFVSSWWWIILFFLWPVSAKGQWCGVNRYSGKLATIKIHPPEQLFCSFFIDFFLGTPAHVVHFLIYGPPNYCREVKIPM